MENFFSWHTKPISDDELEVLLNINNIIKEKVELYGDFSIALYRLIVDTSLEDDTFKIDDEDRLKHYNWCWKKNIDNFAKENIHFNIEGPHYEYFKEFFYDSFYNQKSHEIKESIPEFLIDIFNLNKIFTKSDLDMLVDIYKTLDTNFNYNQMVIS